MSRAIGDTHVTLKHLPSRGVPYASGTQISIRSLKLGEVDFIFEHKDKITDIVKYISQRDIIRGINVTDLTVDDWEFIELTLVNMTFPSAKFELDGGKCPKCGDEVKTIELGEPGSTLKKITIKPNLKSILLPMDISFHTLDDDVDWPIEAELSIGLTQIDFLRIHHFLELAEETGKPQQFWTQRQLAEKMCGYKSEDLSFEDGAILDFIQAKLGHGVINEFNVSCNVCKTEYAIRTAWEVADFIPFWEGGRSAGDRVRFGRGSTSGHNESTGT